MQINLVARFGVSAQAGAPQFRGEEVNGEAGRVPVAAFLLLSSAQDNHSSF